MNREEAINVIKGARQYLTVGNPIWNVKKVDEAFDMAIEALSQPIVVKHFDIQSGYIYCSPQNAENVEVVVRCKDCRYRNGKVNRKGFEVCDATGMDITDEDFCSFGERREE